MWESHGGLAENMWGGGFLLFVLLEKAGGERRVPIVNELTPSLCLSPFLALAPSMQVDGPSSLGS